MGAHGLLMKGPPPYEETYHIPLIVRWPGVVAAGTTSDAPVNSMDLAPTIVEMAGGAPFEVQARATPRVHTADRVVDAVEVRVQRL